MVERGHLNDEQLRDVIRSANTIGSERRQDGLLIEVSRSYLKFNLRESWFTALSGLDRTVTSGAAWSTR